LPPLAAEVRSAGRDDPPALHGCRRRVAGSIGPGWRRNDPRACQRGRRGTWYRIRSLAVAVLSGAALGGRGVRRYGTARSVAGAGEVLSIPDRESGGHRTPGRGSRAFCPADTGGSGGDPRIADPLVTAR